MDKRQLHHTWRFVRRIKPWYFLIAAIICGVVCLVSLRHNNEQMVRLRDAVYAADQNNGDVEGALRNLRAYIYSHMNTSLSSGPNAVHPPIQLKYTFERLESAQQNVLGQGNSSLYQQAQAYCETQTVIGSEVISCIQNYASQHGVSLTPIPDGLYKFDFTSAKWSPDLAGWSMVLTALCALAFLVSAPAYWITKRYLK
ncbi:MAG TPA: hypothetical protein VLF59_05880 [Candidatus Saccharimonadales bacterium]|nr:hypothetical protein [Candidatus Saccharimonadales bacterium]